MAPGWNQSHATQVRGECSNRCVIPAPQESNHVVMYHECLPAEFSGNVCVSHKVYPWMFLFLCEISVDLSFPSVRENNT